MLPLRRPSAKAFAATGSVRERREPLEDEARFLRSWFERPLVTGSVTPSGKMLARMMASYVDPRTPGPVIELGPGTGPVTEALIRRGIEQERLVLVEYNPDFCKLLQKRFPRATILRGDAYNIQQTIGSLLTEKAAATVSSLPLFTKPDAMRERLIGKALDSVPAGHPFIQFSYALTLPVKPEKLGATVELSPWVKLNLPPARVIVYRRPA